MNNTLTKLLILVLLTACQPVEYNSNQRNSKVSNVKGTKIAKAPISEADRVKDGLIIPAIDALSYQLEKTGYNTYVLERINSFLRETSITEFIDQNPTIKEVQKIIESGQKQPKKLPLSDRQAYYNQEVFETF